MNKKNLRKIKSLIFVISGPSGSGKTTILKKIFAEKELKNRLVRSVSFTTRPKRSKEKEGKDYFFISEEDFRNYLKAKKILEWTKYLGYYYGTPKDFIDDQLSKKKSVVFCLDLKGSLRIKKLYPQNTITIFVMPPSLDVLQERIEKRCRRTKKAEIDQRLKLAERELLLAAKYDYCVLNENLEQGFKKLKKIILDAGRPVFL